MHAPLASTTNGRPLAGHRATVSRTESVREGGPSRGPAGRSGADAGLGAQLGPHAPRRGAGAVVGLLDLAVGLGHRGLRVFAGRGSAGRTGHSTAAGRPAKPRHTGRLVLALAALLLTAGDAAGQAPPRDADRPAGEPTTGAPATSPATPPAAKPAAKPQGQGQDGGQDVGQVKPPAPPPAKAAAKPAPSGQPRFLDPAVPDADLTPGALFSRKLAGALAREADVQAYEWATFSAMDPESLNPFQRKRLDRILHDHENFAALVEALEITPLNVPEPEQGVELPTDDLVLLDLIAEAYAASRDPRDAVRIETYNREFLEDHDWGKREAAVRMRDELLERERLFLGLVRRARVVALGRGGDDLREELWAELALAAPRVVERAQDMSRLVLEKEEVRKSVLADVVTWVSEPRAVAGSRADDVLALLEQRNELNVALLERSGLMPVFLQWTGTSTELTEVEAQLEALPRTDIDGRKQTLARKVELLQLQNEIRAQWYSTEPHQETADELIGVLDRLIGAGMAGLGLKGALFSQRHAALDRTREMAREKPVHVWQLLDEQDALLRSIETAEPTQDYLRGLAPPPDVAALEQALAAFKAAASPKPGAKKPGKATNLFKAPAKPKPKGSGAKGGSKKKDDR